MTRDIKVGDWVQCVANRGLEHTFPKGYYTQVLQQYVCFGHLYLTVKDINGVVRQYVRAHRFEVNKGAK